MTAAGLPTHATPSPDTQSYPEVPRLRQLLVHPWPGIHYAQVCTHNALNWQQRGYSDIQGAEYYTITGPKGHASMVLMGAGTPILGASPDSVTNQCELDPDIYKLTGHEDPNGEVTQSQVGPEPGKGPKDPPRRGGTGPPTDPQAAAVLSRQSQPATGE